MIFYSDPMKKLLLRKDEKVQFGIKIIKLSYCALFFVAPFSKINRQNIKSLTNHRNLKVYNLKKSNPQSLLVKFAGMYRDFADLS